MAGNVVSFQELGTPAAPNISALQAMQAPVVMVHKIIPAQRGNGRQMQLVVNGAKKLKAPQILELQDAIVDLNRYPTGGPGFYRFEVSDGASPAKEFWETRLGSTDFEDGAAVAAPASTQPSAPATPAKPADPNIPPAPETVSLGNGFVYNPRFRLLTLPDGRILQWEQSQPLPDLTPNFARFAPPAPATPLGASMFGGPSPEVETLRTELAQMKDAAREQTARQREADLREEHRKQIEALTARTEALIEKMSKPAEDPRMAALERQLEEQRRQEGLRSEFNAKIDALTTIVRESQANRADPMVNTLTALMTQQQAAARDNLSLIRETLTAQLGSAQATALTPDKMLTMLDRFKDSSSSLLNGKVVEVLSGVLDVAMKFRQGEAALNGGGGGTNWMEVLERLADRASGAVQAMGQAKAQQAAAETARANVETVRIQHQRERESRLLPARSAPPAPPASEPAKPLTGEAARDALAEQMFGKPVAPTAPPQLAVVPEPSAVSNPEPAAPVTPPPRAARPDKKNPLARMPVAQLRELYKDVNDEGFFGPFLEVVQQLRDALQADPNSVSPDDVAGYVLEARPQIVAAVQSTGVTPIVVQMLANNRFEFMFERMAPEAGEAYWTAAATALRAKVAAEKAARA